jgi:Helix-hairpin-helix motif
MAAATEVGMPSRVRVNLANAQELLELPGLSPVEVEIIVKCRAEHGPIEDADQLARILNGHPVDDMLKERADFAPSDSTAPEAPGA